MLSRQGFDSHILRFSARLLIEGKVDAKRKFVISYFLSDDTILVTLVPELNSGKIFKGAQAGERTWDLLFFIYFLSQAAPLTTRLLRHPLSVERNETMALKIILMIR